MNLTTAQIQTLRLIEAGKVRQRNTGHSSWRIFGAHPSVVGRVISMKLAILGDCQGRERPITLTQAGKEVLAFVDSPASLCDYELKVLNAFANSTVDDLVQGAALNSAADALVASGYMNRSGDLTERGATALGHSHPMHKKSGAR